MTEENQKKLVKRFEWHFPIEGFENFKRRLSEAPDSCFDDVYNTKMKNKVLGIFISIFLGFLGIDRFFARSKTIGFIKLGAAVLILGIFPLINIYLALAGAIVLYIVSIIDLFPVITNVKICNYDDVNEKLHNAIAAERHAALEAEANNEQVEAQSNI